jgi:hypothetical protein
VGLDEVVGRLAAVASDWRGIARLFRGGRDGQGASEERRWKRVNVRESPPSTHVTLISDGQSLTPTPG